MNVSTSRSPCLNNSVHITVVSEKTLPKSDPQLPNVPTKHGPVQAVGAVPRGSRPSTRTHIEHPVVEPIQEPTKGFAAFKICLSSGSFGGGGGGGGGGGAPVVAGGELHQNRNRYVIYSRRSVNIISLKTYSCLPAA